MDMTDNQRRWWFATHPEYRRSREGNRRHGHIGSKDKPERVDPKQVDEYVDNALQYVHGPVAEILKSTKRHFGTESQPAVPKKYLRLYLASDGSAYGQGADVQAMHDVYRASQQAIEEHRRKYAIGVEEDFDFYMNIIPVGRFITSPMRTLQGLIRSYARDKILSAVKKSGAARSRALGRNLENSGRPKPSTEDHAHHIVPWNHPRAQDARDVLKKWDIPIDGAENGMWLHRRFHWTLSNNHRYMDKMTDRLQNAKSKKEVLKILEGTRDSLSKWKIPE